MVSMLETEKANFGSNCLPLFHVALSCKQQQKF